MVFLNDSILNHLVIHNVGNAHKEQGVFLSNQPLTLHEPLVNVVIPFLSKGFKQAEEEHRFTHSSDIELNEVHHYCKQFFAGEIDFMPFSENIANHLYAHSDHPMIKPGELIVSHLKEVILDGEILEAVALVKCENKRGFIEFYEENNSLHIDLRHGIGLNKLDKGALIFNAEQEEGFRVLAIDSVNEESRFWVEKFLNIKADDVSFAYTKNTLELVQNFAQEVVAEDEDTTARFDVVHKSMDYLQANETFDANEFVEEVLPTPAYREQFMDQHQTMVEQHGYEEVEELKIAPNQVKKAKSKFKDLIRLDNGIQIQLALNNEETKEYLERGFDPVKGMNYYKVYYREEQ